MNPSLTLVGTDARRLIEIGGNTCSLDRNNPKEGALEVCQLDSGHQRGRVEESGTPDQEVRPTSLNGSATEELHLIEEITSTSPVHGTCEDINVVHSAVTNEEKGNMASEVGVSHVPVPWGKLTKGMVMDAFKDVHTGFGTLGPPLHISMNPNVTPIQAHPHRCPVAKEAKASDAIHDLEKQGILSRLHGSPTASIARNPTEAYVCALILATQSIKPLKSQSTPFLQLTSYCLS